jgi:uncharacterized protein YggE
MSNRNRVIWAVIIAWSIIFLGTQINSNWKSWEIEGISVVWEGKSSVTPDTLTINISVSELENTTALAQKESDNKLAKVQEILKTFNIDKKNIKTTNASINPEYDRTTTERKLLGYRSVQSLHIEIDGSGFEQKWADLIAKISEIGGVSVDNTAFSLKDENKATTEAREKAFKDAQQKAEQLAKLAGQKLGKVTLISEQISQSYPTPMYAGKEMMASDSAAGATPLSAGETEVTMNVNVNYEIK